MASARALQALDHIIAGKSYAQAATLAGYGSRGACYHAVDDELQSVRFPKVEEYRKIHLLRLEELYAIARHEVTADMREVGDGAQEENGADADDDGEPQKRKGANLWAVDRCVTILERQSRLLGLDMPVDAAQAVLLPIIREYQTGIAEGV